VSITALAKALSTWETRHIECVNLDVRVKRLSVIELQEAERLTEECSIGNGQNRHVNNLPKLVHGLVSRWFTDADGNPLSGADTVDDAKDWPAQIVTELFDAFGAVNNSKPPDPN
jgi:hypothetical protein